MIDISFSELALIAVVALVVIGPERLPKVARTMGHMMGRLQRYVSEVKADINREIELDELRKLQNEMKDAARGIEQSVHDAARDFESTMQHSAKALETEVAEPLREAAADLEGAGHEAAPAEPVQPALPGMETPGVEPAPAAVPRRQDS